MQKIMIATMLVGMLFAVGCAMPSVSKIRVEVIPPNNVLLNPYPSVQLDATVIK